MVYHLQVGGRGGRGRWEVSGPGVPLTRGFLGAPGASGLSRDLDQAPISLKKEGKSWALQASGSQEP